MKYNNYFNWPGKVWMFSDPHFGHDAIINFERNEFKTTADHDEFILNVINKRIQNGDTLVCLGDLGYKDIWKNCISRIKPGVRKILIRGNHDKESEGVYRKYFDEVYPGPLFVNKFVVLSHEPIPVSEHFLNVHGHLHNSYIDDDHHVNISMKMANYNLVSLDEMYQKTSDYPRIQARFLQEWYADKYVFVNKDRKDAYFYKDSGHVIPKEKIQMIKKNAKEVLNYLDDDRWYSYLASPASKEVNYLSKDSDDLLMQKLIGGYYKYIDFIL